MAEYSAMINILKSKLIKSIFSYITAVTISQICMVFYTIGIIWWLNPEKYGLLAANYATVTMMSFMITLGLHAWLIRTIPKSPGANALTGSIIRFKISIGVFWGLGLWLIMPLVQPNIYQKDLLAIIVLDVWFDSVFNLLLADLLGNEKAQLTSILLISSRALRLFSLAIIIATNTPSIIWISTLRLICTLLVFFIALYLTKPDLKKNQNTDILYVLKYSLVFNASELFNLVFLQLDLNLLTWINGDPEIIGDFAIAISLINMIMTLPLAIVYLVLPSSINIFQNSIKQFQKRIIYLFAGFISLGLLLFFGVRLLSINWIQNIIGQNYVSGINLLLLASPLLLIRTINQFNKAYLLTVGWERKLLLPQAISIILKIICGVFVVAKWEVVGLIYLSIMVDLVLLAGFSLQVFKHRKEKIGLDC